MLHAPALAALLLALSPAFPSFRQVTIDSKVGIGYGLAIADVDGDKLQDILLVDKDVVAWYRNPAWDRRVIAGKLTADDHVCIAARDIDGDGKCEVAVGAAWKPSDTVSSGSVHYLVAPSDRLLPWQPVELHREPTVHRMRWIQDAKGGFDLVVSPLHGRGNQNGAGDGIKLLLYRKPADPKGPWTTELMDGDLHVTHNLEPVQWDEDPEDEVLLAAKEGVFVLDRASGGGAPGKWKRTALGGNGPGETAFQGSSEVRTGKLSGGKRFVVTVEPFHGNKVVVYLPPGAGSGLWTRREIDDTLAEAHAVGVGDFARSGSDQILVGWRRKDKSGKVGIRWYAPRDPEGKEWERGSLDDDTMACEDIAIADLTGDGKLDAVAAGRDTHNLKLYVNEGG